MVISPVDVLANEGVSRSQRSPVVIGTANVRLVATEPPAVNPASCTVTVSEVPEAFFTTRMYEPDESTGTVSEAATAP